MGDILFVGDSHSHGYWSDGRDRFFWQDNLYAKIYSRSCPYDCYVYSTPGAPNSKYPRWIAMMLQRHPGIKTVVIQSTYHDRWLMSLNRDLDYADLALDYFTRHWGSDRNLHCYDDFNTLDYRHIEWSEKPDFTAVGFYEQGLPHFANGQSWPGHHSKYMHIKFHAEVIGHLTVQQYIKDITVIDAVCRQHDARAVLWRINQRTDAPPDINRFCDLTQVKIMHTAADQWLLTHRGQDINTMMLDIEHYDVQAHTLIAEHFMPEVIECAQSTT